ncbi:hypothetical protein [Streptomyces noursei]|uniref:hypothetical protein n=1 Tax=Streptomyces noursei TaxID=1971 RepID=UPI0037FB080C
MWEQHDQTQALARELVAGTGAVLLVVDVGPGALPTVQAVAVAVVAVHDGQALYTALAGEHGTAERGAVLDQLDALLADRRVVREPTLMGPASRYPDALLRLPGQPIQLGPDPLHPWATRSTADPAVAGIWSAWFGWTDSPESTIPSVPRDGRPVPWTRSLDVVADGRSMLASCTASRTAPSLSGAARRGGPAR